MGGLITFLIGIVIIIVVVYAVKLLIDYLELDAPIRKIVMLIVALIALCVLIGLLVHVFGGFGNPGAQQVPW
jgi:hypothetical protein